MIAWLILAACSGDGTRDEEALGVPASPPPEASAPPPPHGALAASARDALVHGDLGGARRDAAGVARALAGAGIGEDKIDERIATVSAAEALARVEHPTDAALMLARLVATCDGCHLGDAPPTGASPAGSSHEGAMRGVWDGFVAGDPARIQRGAIELSTTPMAPVEGASPDAVYEVAKRLAEAKDHELRILAFADLVVACSACHTGRPDGAPAD